MKRKYHDAADKWPHPQPPKPDKKITSKGFPETRHVSVPGYNKGTGTPSWVSKPAKAAERKAK